MIWRIDKLLAEVHAIELPAARQKLFISIVADALSIGKRYNGEEEGKEREILENQFTFTC